MKQASLEPDLSDEVSTIDAASRAAHLWLTQLFRVAEPDQAVPAQRAVAGGFIWELCRGLSLGQGKSAMVAYVYALLSHEGHQAAEISRAMLSCCADPALKPAFNRGVERAQQLLGQLSSNESSAASDTGDF